jgi:hypothetical protein
MKINPNDTIAAINTIFFAIPENSFKKYIEKNNTQNMK